MNGFIFRLRLCHICPLYFNKYIITWKRISGYVTCPGPLFTKRMYFVSRDLVKSRSQEIQVWTFLIVLTFGNIQSYAMILTSNLAASRLGVKTSYHVVRGGSAAVDCWIWQDRMWYDLEWYDMIFYYQNILFVCTNRARGNDKDKQINESASEYQAMEFFFSIILTYHNIKYAINSLRYKRISCCKCRVNDVI